jgi:hypothetical protein
MSHCDGIDNLERACLRPGEWLVESHLVQRFGRKWRLREHDGRDIDLCDSWHAALGRLVDHLNHEKCL